MEFLIGLVIGGVAGGAVVYLQYAKLKRAYEKARSGQNPL